MQIFWVMLLLNALVLYVLSVMLPLTPLWLGGVIGITVFLAIGNIMAKCVK